MSPVRKLGHYPPNSFSAIGKGYLMSFLTWYLTVPWDVTDIIHVGFLYVSALQTSPIKNI